VCENVNQVANFSNIGCRCSCHLGSFPTAIFGKGISPRLLPL
jgi:hypothetical protein